VVAGHLWPDGYHQQLFAVAFFCEVWVLVSSTLVERHCCPLTGLDTAVQNRQNMQLLNMTVSCYGSYWQIYSPLVIVSTTVGTVDRDDAPNLPMKT